MHRGRSPHRRQSPLARSYPSSGGVSFTMKSGSRDRSQRRRSHSPLGRRSSPRRGHASARKSRSPDRGPNKGQRPDSGNRRRPGLLDRKRSASPRNRNVLSSPPHKRRSSSPSRRPVRNKGGPTARGGSPLPLQRMGGRAFSPRRELSPRNRSDVRSHSSGGRMNRVSPPVTRRCSRSPVVMKKPNDASMSPEWRTNRSGSRNEDMRSMENMMHCDQNRMPLPNKAHPMSQGKGSSYQHVGKPRGFDSPLRRNVEKHSQLQLESSHPMEWNTKSEHKETERMYPSEEMRNNDYLHGSTVRSQEDFLRGGGGGMNKSEEGLEMRGSKLYTQEELKKITVDIYRAMPQENPGKRLVVNPGDVVVVRRPGEGLRPIFDRDDIKHAQSERGDGGLTERRVVAVVKERSRSRSPRMNLSTNYSGREERENFQINREQFHQYGQSELDNCASRPSLNDRWQKMERTNVSMRVNRTEPMAPDYGPNSYSGSDFQGRSRPDDDPQNCSRIYSPHSRQLTPDRYGERPRPRSLDGGERCYSPIEEQRDSYDRCAAEMEMMQQRPLPVDPHDLRHSLSYKRRQSWESKQKFTGRDRQDFGRDRETGRDQRNKFSRQRSGDGSGERPDTTSYGRGRETSRNGRSEGERNWDRRFQEREGGSPWNQSKLPDFSSRPDKYRYQEWLDKPDVVPKGPSYFEHDNRGDGFKRNGRGRGFVVRGRGSVSRGRIKGANTSSFRGGGGGVGGRMDRGNSTGNHGTAPRNKWSPNEWVHDMYDTSPDRTSVQDNKPSSTTGNK